MVNVVSHRTNRRMGLAILMQFGGRFASRVLAAALQAATLVLLARMGGPSAFGVFAAVTATGYLANAVTSAGTSVRVLRINAEPGQRERLAGSFLTIRLVGSLLIISVGCALSLLTDQRGPAVAAAILVAADNLGDYAQAFYSGMQRHTKASTFIVAQRLIPLVAIVPSTWSSGEFEWTQLTVVAFILTVATALVLVRDTTPTMPGRGLRGTGGYWLAALSSNALQLQIPALATVVNAATVGLYSIATRLMGPLTILVSALQSIAVPHLAAQLGKPAYARGVRLLLSLSCAYGLALSLMSPLGAALLIDLLGSDYERARSLLVAMFIAAGLSAVAQALQADLIAAGLPSRSATVVLGGTILGIGWLIFIANARGGDLLWTCPLVIQGLVTTGMAIAAFYRRPHGANPVREVGQPRLGRS